MIRLAVRGRGASTPSSSSPSCSSSRRAGWRSVDGRRRRRVRGLRGAGRAAGPARPRGGRRRGAGRGHHHRGRRRLGRALEGVPPARSVGEAARAPAVGAAARRPARGGHRPRPRRSAPARTRPRGCASSCCSSSSPAARCVDVGCGSGVLAIAAARLGWAPVLGVDHERESVQATLDNAAANGVGAAGAPPRPPARRAGARRARSSWPTCCARCCCASRRRLRRTAPDVLVASGLLAHEGDEVAAAFARHGLREAARRHGGEWVALLLRR